MVALIYKFKLVIWEMNLHKIGFKISTLTFLVVSQLFFIVQPKNKIFLRLRLDRVLDLILGEDRI